MKETPTPKLQKYHPQASSIVRSSRSLGKILQSLPLMLVLGFFTLFGSLGITTMIREDSFPFWNLGSFIQGNWRAELESTFESSLPLSKTWRSNWYWLQYGFLGQGLPGLVIGTEGWLFTSEEWDPVPIQNQLMIQNLIDARDQLNKKGIELLIVPVPAKHVIYQDFVRSPLDRDFEHRYSHFLQLLQDLGIPGVDLEQYFLAHRNSVSTGANDLESLFLRTDTHWTPQGSRLAAEGIARVVGSLDLVETNQSWVFESHQRDLILYQGDLLGFLPEKGSDTPGAFSLPGLMNRFRPLPIPDQIPQYETSMISGPTLGLFDTPEIPVALVGTSYSAGEAWNFPGFLQEALGLDLISFAQEARGPWEPMVQALENPSLEELGVQLVIWEIPIRFIPVGLED